MPKIAKPGDILKGNLELVSNDVKDKLYSVSYCVPPEAKAEDVNLGTKLPEKTDMVKFEEALKDFEIGQISKLKTNEAKIILIEKLEQKYERDLSFVKQKIELQCEMGRSELETPVPSLKLAQSRISTANAAIKLVDESSVAIYFGTSHDLSRKNEAEQKLNTEMELKKEILALSYRSLTEALITAVIFKEQTHLDTNESFQAVDLDSKHVDEIIKEFTANLKKYGQWTSANPCENGYYLTAFCWCESRLGHFGTSLLKIHSFLSNKKNISKYSTVYPKLADEKRVLLGKLDWKIWQQHEDAWKVVNFPKALCRF